MSLSLGARSVRSSITLWYLSILAITLVFFGVILYTVVSASLIRDLHKTLVLEAQNIEGAVYSYWRAEQTSNASGNWKDSPAGSLAGLASTGEIAALINRWAAHTGTLSDRPVRILDRTGRILSASPSMAYIGSGIPPVETTGIRADDEFREFYAAGVRHMFVTHPVLEEGTVVYVIQAALPASQMDVSRRQLLIGLMLVIPWTLLTASAVGWFLASRALAPVDRMVRQAQLITAERLDRRIDVPKTGDELERLAATFNHLLDRIEGGLKRLRQFSAAASHELRTPLTVMKGELELALSRPRSNEEYQRVLRTHLETIDDMTRIVKELLALARSEAVEEALSIAPVVLNDVIQKTRQTWFEVAQSREIRFTVRDGRAVSVQGDRNLLERLLANLLDNAFKHTPAGGRITVELGQSETQAFITVRDTGPGIAEEDRADIFNRFFSKRHPGEPDGSSGLGLGLCKWIAEAHHGRIEIRNDPRGGAVFTVYLPAAGDAAPIHA